MLDWLKDDVFAVDDVISLMTSKVPDKLAEIYKQIFLKYQRDQFKYVRYADLPVPWKIQRD
jgi:hypothetical protein